MNRRTGWDALRSWADRLTLTPRVAQNNGRTGQNFSAAPTVLTVAILATMLSLAGCSNSKPQATALAQAQTSDTPHNVTLTKVQQQSIQFITVEPSEYRTAISTTGVVDFNHNRAVNVLAPFSGAVTSVPVELGQYVNKGQVLAEVHSPDFTAAAGAYRKAVLAVKVADAVAANDRALLARQAISQRESAQAQVNAASARADRNAALQTLIALHVTPRTIAAIRSGRPMYQQAAIRAPISGTLVAKSIASGQTLTAGASPCFTIANTSVMWVMAHVFGNEIPRVSVGDSAVVNVGDGSAPVRGVVTNISSVVNPNTRSVQARVRVDNPSGALKEQMYVTVHIQSRSQLKGILIPVSAVLRNSEDLPFVYIVMPNGSYARRPITLGPRIQDQYVIPEGLHPGDEVVVDGSIFLNFIQTQ